MRNAMIKTLLLSLSLFFLFGCAGTSNYMVKAEKPVENSKEKANVYFMRPSGMGFAINFQIWDGDKFVGLSQAKSYFRYVCDPGKHLFIAIAENKTFVPAELEAGKRYYVVTGPRMGWIKARIGLTPVKKGSEEMGKVKDWEGDLEYIAPIDENVKTWESLHKEEARALVQYFDALSQEKKAEYIVLSPDDGI